MRYLLDTTVLSPYFAGQPQARLLLRQLAPDGIAVSILSYLEGYQGVIENVDPERAKRRFDAFFRTAQILPVSPRWHAAVPRFARISNSRESNPASGRSTS